MQDSSIMKILKLLAGFSMSAWINAVINFFIMPIITRIIAPQDLGRIDLFVTFCNMFVYASTLGMHQSYMRFFNEKIEGLTKRNLFSLSIKLSGLGAIFASIVCFAFNRYFSVSVLGYQTLSIAICMAIFIMFSGFIQILKTKPRMYGDVITYTIIVVVESLIIKLTYISIYYTKSIEDSINILIVMMALLTISGFLYSKKDIFVSINTIKWTTICSILKYAIPTVPVMFITNVNASLPKLFLQHYWSTAEIGIYTGCLTLVSIINLMQAGLNVFWGPYVFENYKNNQNQIQLLHRIITFVIVVFGLGLLLTQDIIYLILGSNYRASEQFYGLLLAAPIFYTISETLGIGISINKKTYLNIVVVLVACVSNLLLCAILIPLFGNMGAAFSVMISSVLMLITKSMIGEKLYKVITNPIKTVTPIGIYLMASVLSSITYRDSLIHIIMVFSLIVVLLIIYRKEMTEGIHIFMCRYKNSNR